MMDGRAPLPGHMAWQCRALTDPDFRCFATGHGPSVIVLLSAVSSTQCLVAMSLYKSDLHRRHCHCHCHCRSWYRHPNFLSF